MLERLVLRAVAGVDARVAGDSSRLAQHSTALVPIGRKRQITCTGHPAAPATGSHNTLCKAQFPTLNSKACTFWSMTIVTSNFNFTMQCNFTS